MPLGKSGQTPSGSNGNNGQERPVVFQKYFKSGARTYAAQIKLAVNGRKYMILTEGVRDPETQEVKKHYIRVHEPDLKQFFAMLQETVLYLRAAKSLGNSVAGVVATQPPTPVITKPAKVAAKAPPPTVKSSRPATKTPEPIRPPQKIVKPPIAQAAKSAKPGYRATGARSR